MIAFDMSNMKADDTPLVYSLGRLISDTTRSLTPVYDRRLSLHLPDIEPYPQNDEFGL